MLARVADKICGAAGTHRFLSNYDIAEIYKDAIEELVFIGDAIKDGETRKNFTAALFSWDPALLSGGHTGERIQGDNIILSPCIDSCIYRCQVLRKIFLSRSLPTLTSVAGKSSSQKHSFLSLSFPTGIIRYFSRLLINAL